MKIIALIGKAGSGKDTILNNTCDIFPHNFHEIVSCTTRPPREGEVDGINYHFISEDEFIRKIEKGDMLEFTHFNGWYYGADKSTFSEDLPNIGVFNPEGVEQILERASDIELKTYLVSATDRVRIIRQLQRETKFNMWELFRRWVADEKDFDPMRLKTIPLEILRNEDQADIFKCADKIFFDAKSVKQ